MVETGVRDADVLGHRVGALALELERQRVLEGLEVHAEKRGADPKRDRVLDHPVAATARELAYRRGAQVHALARFPRRDRVAVEDHPAARSHQAEVAVHSVLIETHQHVEAVAVAVDRPVGDANGKEDVAAAHDRLISVVGVEVKAAACEDAREDVSRRGDALSGRATDGQRKVEPTCVHEPLEPRRRWGGRTFYPVVGAIGRRERVDLWLTAPILL